MNPMIMKDREYQAAQSAIEELAAQAAQDMERKNTANDVTSFFYYMWNRWSKEECEHVFRDGDHRHFWNKWCEAYDTMNGPRGATELFYMALSDTNRDRLVARALECYDGMTEKQ